MEQAINTFSKGLQTDTHPMVQGNDTLSDALNATFVTMNGNEVILQNDMGNRRVDNAFLPPGYEPVGIKEYGGIIYIACYNPLTGNGQIGSFPSPERKAGNNKNNLKELNLLEFFSEQPQDGVRYIEKESISIKLTEESLHAGDKFGFKSSDIDDYMKYLIPNLYNGKLRNNLYTLQIGVFNSQNQFIDITDSLKTFYIEDENGLYIKNQNEEYVIPENYFSGSTRYSKYFIEEGEADTLEETTDDQEFIEQRKALDYNVYSSKLVSSLYLKASINYIKNHSYTINGALNGDGSLTLYIIGRYECNCPWRDFPIRFSYKTLSENQEINNNINSSIGNSTAQIISNPEYNELTNQWITEVLYTINISDYQTYLEFKIENILEPQNTTDINFFSEYPIVTNTYTGRLDTTKLGNDTIEFKGWRYYNYVSERQSLITFDIEAYPRYGESNLREVYIQFYEYESQNDDNPLGTITLISEPNGIQGGGTFTVQFDWPIDLDPGKLYKCKFWYKKYGYDHDICLNSQDGIWFLTTELFNGNFEGYDTFDLENNPTNAKISGENNPYPYIDLDGSIYYSYDIHKNVFIEDFTKIKRILLRPYFDFKYNNSQTKSNEQVVNRIIDNINPEYSVSNNIELSSEIKFN